MANAYAIVRAIVFTTLLGLVAGSPAPSAAQTAEADAVKQVIQDQSKAFEAKDLDAALSYVADDAQIDSRAAGKVVNKSDYRAAMTRALASIVSVQPRNLKVTFTDPETATVDGEMYIRAGGPVSGSYNQWTLKSVTGSG